MSSLAEIFLNLSPRVLTECAMGWDDPVPILLRNGLTKSQATALSTTPMFLSAVEDKKEELVKAGYSMRVKSRLYSEALVDSLGQRALDPACEHKDALETLKVLAKYGYGDSMDATAGAAPKFSITINLSPTEKITVTADASRPPTDEDIEDITDVIENEAGSSDERPAQTDFGTQALTAPAFAFPSMDF